MDVCRNLWRQLVDFINPASRSRDELRNEKSASPEECHTRKTVIPEMSIEVFVTGQTFGTENLFVNRVDQHLKNCGINLRRANYNHNSDRLLLLFCPVVSRVGTDIGNALEKVAAGREIILVVMHHVPNESLALHTDSRSQHQNSAIICSVDCRFSQASGLYHSTMNTTAITSVSSMLQKKVERCR